MAIKLSFESESADGDMNGSSSKFLNILVHTASFASGIEAKTNGPQTNSSIAVKNRYSLEDLNQKYDFNMNDFLTLTSKDKI